MKQELIVKSNEILIHPLYKTALELKILSKIILEVRKNPEEDRIFLNKRELLEALGCDKNSYSELKKVAERMFRPIDMNRGKGNFILRAVFMEINADFESEIMFEISPKMKPYFVNLTKNFTQYYFENIARLKSNFSIRIYELLKQHEKILKVNITILDLKFFLNISDEKFTKYNDFKRFVLLVAQSELKEKTDIYFEFEEIKKGRRVEEIKFLIFRNNNGSSKKEENKEVEVKLTEEQILLKNKLINDYKISQKVASNLIASVSIKQIEDNITYAEKEYKSGIITKNFTGYLLEAIRNNYASNISLFEIDTREKKEKEKRKAMSDEKREALESKLSKDFATQARKGFIDSLTEEQKQDLMDQILKDVELDAYTTAQVKKKGLNTPAIYLLLNQKIEGFAENREVFIAEGLRKAGF